MAALEGGAAAVAASSGQSAQFMAIATIAGVRITSITLDHADNLHSIRLVIILSARKSDVCSLRLSQIANVVGPQNGAVRRSAFQTDLSICYFTNLIARHRLTINSKVPIAPALSSKHHLAYDIHSFPQEIWHHRQIYIR